MALFYMVFLIIEFDLLIIAGIILNIYFIAVPVTVGIFAEFFFFVLGDILQNRRTNKVHILQGCQRQSKISAIFMKQICPLVFIIVNNLEYCFICYSGNSGIMYPG
ncbi:hypothetical protein ROZALSC1DRAFT_26352 [Rozella allomycis CSF55]|uniref:Uncharacterized protein n=1 Tax=Rozella allomycis (strain CSF55) TaxID=988480 RepID=A0A4P9Y8Q4_ROZAC|nr:hypothetical protein ROZALSC1DRAFT_26352 [Rozella allomycis CSF55]